jgi:hypothetical protein
MNLGSKVAKPALRPVFYFKFLIIGEKFIQGVKDANF